MSNTMQGTYVGELRHAFGGWNATHAREKWGFLEGADAHEGEAWKIVEKAQRQ